MLNKVSYILYSWCKKRIRMHEMKLLEQKGYSFNLFGSAIEKKKVK